MKNDKLQDSIGMIGEDLIERARQEKKSPKINRWVLAMACISVAMLATVIILKNITISQPEQPQKPYFGKVLEPLADCSYPARVQYAGYVQSDDWQKYNAWLKDKADYTIPYKDVQIDLDNYLSKIMKTFLSNTEENTVFSPINAYMALSMLAEISDTEGQRELLNILGVENIEDLRKQSAIIWNAHYYNDSVTTSILANSIWLDGNRKYNQSMLDNLTGNYFASVYSGMMGSETMNNTIRYWIYEKTNGRLDSYGKELKTKPEDKMVIVSTLYFKAGWEDSFSEKNTKRAYFYKETGKERCDFLNSKRTTFYYQGDNFSAIELPFSGGCSMKVFLPDEGVGINDLMDDSQFVTAAFTSSYNKEMRGVKVSIPKFDVSSQIDMNSGLRKLGATQIFEHLNPYYDMHDAYVDEIKHSARVSIDEEGCEGAAYTNISLTLSASAEPENTIQFNVNRPFVFVITSEVGAPLFVGVVHDV